MHIYNSKKEINIEIFWPINSYGITFHVGGWKAPKDFWGLKLVFPLCNFYEDSESQLEIVLYCVVFMLEMASYIFDNNSY